MKNLLPQTFMYKWCNVRSGNFLIKIAPTKREKTKCHAKLQLQYLVMPFWGMLVDAKKIPNGASPTVDRSKHGGEKGHQPEKV